MAETETLEATYERVANGIEWLTANDPSGGFNAWFEAGIHPRAPMPAQTQEVRDAYARYYDARALWERLWKRMLALEKAEGVSFVAVQTQRTFGWAGGAR